MRFRGKARRVVPVTIKTYKKGGAMHRPNFFENTENRETMKPELHARDFINVFRKLMQIIF